MTFNIIKPDLSNIWSLQFPDPKLEYMIITDASNVAIGCVLHQTQNLHTTAYHPQSNWLIERFERTLKNYLLSFSINSDWVVCLPLLVCRNIPSNRSWFICFSDPTLLYKQPVSGSCGWYSAKVILNHFKSLDTTSRSEVHYLSITNSLVANLYDWSVNSGILFKPVIIIIQSISGLFNFRMRIKKLQSTEKLNPVFCAHS